MNIFFETLTGWMGIMSLVFCVMCFTKENYWAAFWWGIIMSLLFATTRAL